MAVHVSQPFVDLPWPLRGRNTPSFLHASFRSANVPLAVLLGVPQKWHIPLLLCRALSTIPAVWWAGKCGLMVVKEVS